MNNGKIVVTAALPYANGPIHIGHLLEYIQADIFSRFLKLQGKDALYICASDMHGTPIEVNAAKEGILPEVFVEKYWQEHQRDFASFLIQFDNYYKTHSSENKLMAEFFYTTLKKKGLIYRKKIKVMFCPSCKRSLPDRFIRGDCPHCRAGEQYGDICEKCSSVLKGIDLLNPYCVLCKNTPIQKESEHYFFKLSSFAAQLKRWIESVDSFIQTEVRNWLEEWLSKGLDDWCISRDGPYFGFEIPDAELETGEKKYFYVWLDAPIGYISSTQNYCVQRKLHFEDYWYKGQVYHFIGKDIAYFHYLFWPAMLMGMAIPVPQLSMHGFITVDGQKMSKSRGTFFTAQDFLKLYPAEALRFFYASHLDRKVADVDLNLEEFKAVNNNVLVGSLGNFCYRVLTFAQKNYGDVEKIADEKELSAEILSLLNDIQRYYLALDFKSAVRLILQVADKGNAYFQKSEVWKQKDTDFARQVLGWCVNLARNLAIIVQPILPAFSLKIERALGGKVLSLKDIGFSWIGKISLVEMLVAKIEDAVQVTFPLRLMVGHVKEVRDHPNADSLYVLQVDFGDAVSRRQVVAGLKKHFSKEELIGKKAVFCVNMKAAKLRGEMSEAMILVAEELDESHLSLLSIDAGLTKGDVVDNAYDVAVGDEVQFEGMNFAGKEVTYDDFKKILMKVLDGGIVYEEKKLMCKGRKVVVIGVKDGGIVR